LIVLLVSPPLFFRQQVLIIFFHFHIFICFSLFVLQFVSICCLPVFILTSLLVSLWFLACKCYYLLETILYSHLYSPLCLSVYECSFSMFSYISYSCSLGSECLLLTFFYFYIFTYLSLLTLECECPLLAYFYFYVLTYLHLFAFQEVSTCFLLTSILRFLPVSLCSSDSECLLLTDFYFYIFIYLSLSLFRE
jgi:hypothetical protein